MQKITKGERRKSFPSFLSNFFILLITLALGNFLIPLSPAVQQAEGKELSRFDRLAEEATQLNKRGNYGEVIRLLAPHKGDPKNDNALFFNELGIAYRHQQQLPEAASAYRESLIRDPQNPVVLKNLGDVLYLQKDYAQAIELYQQVIRSNPYFEQAHYSLGLAYYRLEKYPESLEEFEKVLSLNPQDESAKKFRDAILKKMEKRK
jgi:tetratricopeptide (TPR) repeat protein